MGSGVPAMNLNLECNQRLAIKLIESLQYEAGIKAIMDVKRSSSKDFLVIEAPSGTGKTLFGVQQLHNGTYQLK